MEWVKYVLESEIRRLNDCKKLSLKKLQNPQLEDTWVKHENATIEDCDNKIKEVYRHLMPLQPKFRFRGEILNGEGNVIFSRTGFFHTKEDCIKVLHSKDIVDSACGYSLEKEIKHGRIFKDSPYCLNDEDISEFTFQAIECKNQ
jgi:hypothetical protein